MPHPTESFISYAGHRLAILAYEHPAPTDPPVVWIHGLTASVRFWEAAMYDTVRNHRSWYSVSLPLHHPSDYRGRVTAGQFNEAVFAHLVDRAVRSVLGTQRFHLVGYSLGGFAALNYVAKFPGQAISVVSVGGFMTGRARGLEGVLQFFSKGHLLRKALFYGSWWVMQRHVCFLKLATLAYARRWRQLLAYPALDPTLRAIFPDFSRHSIRGQRALFRYLLDMDLMDEVEAITLPVLVVAGERDPIIPFDHQRQYASRLRNSTFVALPGVGHVAFAEAPRRFRRHLLAWLKDHDGEGVTVS